MAKGHSSVTGAKEIVSDLHQVSDDLDLGNTLAQVAIDAARRRAPTRAQLVATVNARGASLNYSGVITPDRFEAYLADNLQTNAVTAVDREIDAATQRADLT